jgi:hypothetical protein
VGSLRGVSEGRSVRSGTNSDIINFLKSLSNTYDHRILNIALPVRSAVLKQDTGGLVVRWVTTSESPLLYVFACLYDLFHVCSGLLP